MVLAQIRRGMAWLFPRVFIGVCGYAGAVLTGADWDLRPPRAFSIVGVLLGATAALIVLVCADAALEPFRYRRHRRGGSVSSLRTP
jgi:uncharacterized membrane protein